jgi:Cft2 family RNA processing exonuclease
MVLNFGQDLELDDVRIRLYPAGHVLGSSMIHIENAGGGLLYTGDFKMQESWTAESIEIPCADILIMESTFGDPQYCFNSDREKLVDELVRFVDDAICWGCSPVVLAYNLGKAQEAMKVLGDLGYKVKAFNSAWEIAQVYCDFGIQFNNCTPWDGQTLAGGEVLVIPPHVKKFRSVQSLPRLRTVLLSGWANSDKTRYRYGADQAIALSDHADFDELLEFVRRVKPKKVYCTHGLEEFPRHLRRIGFNAELLKPSHQLSL